MTVDKEKVKAILQIVLDRNKYMGNYRITHTYCMDGSWDFKDDHYSFEFIPSVREGGTTIMVIVKPSKGNLSIQAWGTEYGTAKFLIECDFDKEELLGVIGDLTKALRIQQLENLDLFIDTLTH